MAVEVKILEVARWIVSSKRIVVFTGAGISTESGIPDFRSPGGIWERFDPREFTYQHFLSSAENRKVHWKLFREMYEGFPSARPNPAHLAIAELEKIDKLHAVITQNIDNLHQIAGNSPQKVIELHGTLEKIECVGCGRIFSRSEVLSELKKEKEKIPACNECSGILKPAVVFFGEAMPADEMERAHDLAVTCDLCFSIGSSLVVYPAAHFPLLAKQKGAKLVIINKEPTHADQRADAVLHRGAGETMSKLMQAVRDLGDGKRRES